MISNPRAIGIASALIGTPWTPEHNCWWLVRHWFHQVVGSDLPDIDVLDAGADHHGQIAHVCAAGALRFVGDALAQPGDIALLRNPGSGARHVGVLLWANGELCLLHSEGAVDAAASAQAGRVVCTGPGVVCEPLVQALGRYHGLELWRRVCAGQG